MRLRRKLQKQKEEQRKLKHKTILNPRFTLFRGFFYVKRFCFLGFLNAILRPMKKLAILLFLMICSASVFAKDPESKTFLVLFKSKGLKEIKTTIRAIESQFSSVFSTRYYSGNSELALIIEIPFRDFDECFLGEFLIDLEDGKKVQLQQIAFRLFDLTENKSLHQQYLALYEDSLLEKKKAAKASKADPKP
jgi:hypothetical protein